MKQEIKYKAHGIVLGNYWGGGMGSYPAQIIYSSTKEDLINQANKKLKDGSLDSGMGFESLIGAVLVITTIIKIWIEDKDYLRFEYSDLIIGDLTEEQIEFLKENM